MHKILSVVFIIMVSYSCGSKASGENNDTQATTASMEEQLQELKRENLRKDSLIVESITYYNEIERNLSDIQLKENEIKTHFALLYHTDNNEKENILRKIRHINELRLENTRKFNALQRKMDTITVAENQFKEMITRLRSEMTQKDKAIDKLRKSLEIKGQEYTSLFGEYQAQVKQNQEQEALNEELERRLNLVYYAAGSMQELKKNNVVSSKGLLRKATINDNLNESYFTRIEADRTKEIVIHANKITLMTNHNTTSYTITEEGKQTKLRILDPAIFWKTSRYLVILTQ